MLSPTKAIIREATRDNTKPLNIVVGMAHERYEPYLAKTGHNFFSIIKEGETKTWNTQYAPIPENYHIFRSDKFPQYVDVDLLISHNPFVHIPILHNLRGAADIPLLNVFHTMPSPGWQRRHTEYYKQLFDVCQHHVSISEHNRDAWFIDDHHSVIYHGIDTEQFALGTDKKPIVLTVANDFINRDWALGYNLWKTIVSQSIPYRVVGNTPGLSVGSKNVAETIAHDQEAMIYLNTTLASPIPMSVLEAMSCGCAVVSTDNCALPYFIEHENTGFIFPANQPHKFVQCIRHLLANPNEAIEIGLRARKRVQELCSMTRFVDEWNALIQKMVNRRY